MTVKQALKEKNKLVTEIKTQYELARKYNSIEEGNPRRYNITECLERAADLTQKLVELKTKIHKANAPVYDKIFLMSELKMRAKLIKSMECEEGKVTERYGSVASVKTVEINVKEKDLIVKLIEMDIEKLQDELDTHNATTHIE